MKHTLALTSLLISVTIATACTPATTTPVVVRATPAPPYVAWKIETAAAVFSSPTVEAGVTYFGSDDGYLYAANADTGELYWRFQTEGAVRSHPAIDGAMIYFTSDDGHLYAVSTQTGEQVWRVDIGADAYRPIWDYLQSSPSVSDGTVYVGSADHNIHAIDGQTGAELWRFETRDRVRSSPLASDGIVYSGSWDGNVYALEAQTGELLWTFDSGGPVQCSPVVSDGIVYIGSRGHYLYAIDGVTGEEVWSLSYNGSWVESTVRIVDGVIYTGSSDALSFYAVDRATGEELWTVPTQEYPWSSPAIADGFAYIGSTDRYRGNDIGHLYAINLETRETEWQLTFNETLDPDLVGVVSSPAFVEGMIYFGSLDGYFYAVRVN